MEDQCSPLSWGYYYQEEGIEEYLKHSLLYTTLELETTTLSAHEEIARKEDELIHLRDLLTKTIKERDEAQEKCQLLKLEKVVLQQGTIRKEDELKWGGPKKGISSSDSRENIASAGMYHIPQPSLPPPPQVTKKLVVKKPLPENGKFLQAVMEAGPLLQTLLLAGPLPQWQHPPPQLNSMEIPPVTITSPISTSGGFSKKRFLVPFEASDSSPNTKYQKVVHQSPLING